MNLAFIALIMFFTDPLWALPPLPHMTKNSSGMYLARSLRTPSLIICASEQGLTEVAQRKEEETSAKSIQTAVTKRSASQPGRRTALAQSERRCVSPKKKQT